MQLVVLGLNHRSAAVEVRERFAFDKNEVPGAAGAGGGARGAARAFRPLSGAIGRQDLSPAEDV